MQELCTFDVCAHWHGHLCMYECLGICMHEYNYHVCLYMRVCLQTFSIYCTVEIQSVAHATCIETLVTYKTPQKLSLERLVVLYRPQQYGNSQYIAFCSQTIQFNSFSTTNRVLHVYTQCCTYACVPNFNAWCTDA